MNINAIISKPFSNDAGEIVEVLIEKDDVDYRVSLYYAGWGIVPVITTEKVVRGRVTPVIVRKDDIECAAMKAADAKRLARQRIQFLVDAE